MSTPLSYAKFYAVLMKSRLPMGVKATLTALVDLQTLGINNPKIDALAARTGQSHPTVTRALQRLRELKLIEVVKGQRQNAYRIAAMRDWAAILLDQNDPAEPIPARSKRSGALDQNDLAEASAPYSLSDSSLQTGVSAAAALLTSTQKPVANGVRSAAAAATHTTNKMDPPSELCRELLSRHPHPQQPQKADAELAKALQTASAALIRERHAAWCEYWAANPQKFVPHLWRWFADGDWETAPRKPVPLNRKTRALELYLAASR